MKDGRKTVETVEGRGFQYKGVALHLRKINSLWVISFFNTGLLTRGSARTIEEAIAKAMKHAPVRKADIKSLKK